MSDSWLLTEAPVARAAMLIRRPAAEVFEAIINPEITTKFWFTRGSGRLEQGATVRWDWEMFGVHADVLAREVEPDRRVLIDWWSGDETPTTVEWRLTPVGSDATFLEIANSGFSGDGDSVVSQALDSKDGFMLVIAGMKAWLEHGVALNLVPDRFPAEMREG